MKTAPLYKARWRLYILHVINKRKHQVKAKQRADLIIIMKNTTNRQSLWLSCGTKTKPQTFYLSADIFVCVIETTLKHSWWFEKIPCFWQYGCHADSVRWEDVCRAHIFSWRSRFILVGFRCVQESGQGMKVRPVWEVKHETRECSIYSAQKGN